MSNIRWRVKLSASERDELKAMLAGGRERVRRIKRAQILLAADRGTPDAKIARSAVCALSTVTRIKRRYVEGSLEWALSEAPRPGAARKLTGNEEALLVAIASSKPPAGHDRWTLELLCDEMVRLTGHDSISRETVRRRLAEYRIKPRRKNR
ncbi:MAG: helix-turn-helix domain-containing protein [Rhodobacteraceae bacterium]|nr:helix-turn-helix domain-containing protein [Paracoccaceae bacterium]